MAGMLLVLLFVRFITRLTLPQYLKTEGIDIEKQMDDENLKVKIFSEAVS